MRSCRRNGLLMSFALLNDGKERQHSFDLLKDDEAAGSLTFDLMISR
jgi:hypothetical protein